LDIYDGNDIPINVRKNPLSCPHDILSIEQVLGRSSLSSMSVDAFGELLEAEVQKTRDRRAKGVF
jgi:hypothetical protein